MAKIHSSSFENSHISLPTMNVQWLDFCANFWCAAIITLSFLLFLIFNPFLESSNDPNINYVPLSWLDTFSLGCAIYGSRSPKWFAMCYFFSVSIYHYVTSTYICLLVLPTYHHKPLYFIFLGNRLYLVAATSALVHRAVPDHLFLLFPKIPSPSQCINIF